MKKQKKHIGYFPFEVSEPFSMTVLEQVFCVVWLAERYNLDELRIRQSLIEQQFVLARQNSCTKRTFDNLYMMQSVTDSAVAYQTFYDDTWTSFIKI
jgi:hypothetical protein